MGGPMLAALCKAGFSAQGFDVKPAAGFGPLAPMISNDAPALYGHVNVLLSVVRDIAQTEALLFDDQAFVHRATALETVILSSTLSPDYVRDLRARVPSHIALIDAPMSGAAIAAQECRLSFMLGGSAADLDPMQPLFAAMGRSFHRMGPYGAGMSAKVLNNLLAASNTVMTRLALDWADQQGIDEEKLLALIHASSGQNWFASGFQQIEFARDGFDPENTIGILKKDVQSALASAPEGADRRLPDLLVALIERLKPRA